MSHEPLYRAARLLDEIAVEPECRGGPEATLLVILAELLRAISLLDDERRRHGVSAAHAAQQAMRALRLLFDQQTQDARDAMRLDQN